MNPCSQALADRIPSNAVYYCVKHSTVPLPNKRCPISELGKFVNRKMLIVRELSLDMEIFLAYVHSQPGLKRETEQYLKQKSAIDPRRRSRRLPGPRRPSLFLVAKLIVSVR
jgi:hypothetical protein